MSKAEGGETLKMNNGVGFNIVFNNFHNFPDEKPEEFNNCIIVWGDDAKGETNIMFGSYYPEKHIFRDGLGGCLDEEWVRLWTYDYEGIVQ